MTKTIFIFFLLPLTVFGQKTPLNQNSFNKILERLQTYESVHLTEQVYLHFDKPYYAAGDTMYFKAYVTQGNGHELTKLSGVLYADLIDQNNKISQSLWLQIADGVAWGDFALPATSVAGSYRVRAYTRFMQNEGSTVFYDQNIAIGATIGNNAPGGLETNSKTEINKPDIGFFPEGGSLVTGVRSKIAFKAVGPDGLGVNVKGTLIDSDNKELDTFSSTHLGMGYFYFTPLNNKSYKAKLTYATGQEDVIDLPVSALKGIKLTVEDLGNSIMVKINSNEPYFNENKNKLFTLLVFATNTHAGTDFELNKSEIAFNISKKDFNTAIVKVTLFSKEQEPLCERLLFVQKNDLLNLNIGSDKIIYPARGMATIKVNALSGTGSPSSGHFSVSVIDENKVPVNENTEHTIIDNLLLTSELKGYIEQPGYYFTNPNDTTNANLDLVMLTHGYRRFEWKRVLSDSAANNKPLLYLPEKGLSIGGTVKFNGNPVKGGAVKLLSKVNAPLMLDTVSNGKGDFLFDNLIYRDTTKFVIQARTAKNKKDVEIQLNTVVLMPEVSPVRMPAIKTNDNLNSYVQSSKKFFDEQFKYGINKHTVMLKEVVIKEKKKDTLFLHSQNLNGPGNADQVITSEWLEKSGFMNLWDALRAKLTGVEFNDKHQLVSKRTAQKIVPRVDESGKLIYQEPVEVIVDGAVISQTGGAGDPRILDRLEVSDIESVEYLNVHYAAVYGPAGAGGVLVITTKRAKALKEYYRDAPGVIVYKAKGFYKAREFYAPRYDHPVNDMLKDLRTTIYWNPEVATDKEGKASFQFYNADGKGTYRLTIEGIDADGNLGRQVYRYKVE